MRAWFFVLLLCLGLCSCEAQQSGADFYEGLKRRQSDSRAESAAYFEKALRSPNDFIAAAAAAELMRLHYNGAALSAAAKVGIRAKAAGSWAAALDALEDMPQAGEKILALLLTGDSRTVLDLASADGVAAHYALREWRNATTADADEDEDAGAEPENALSEAENAAIDGRLAVSRSRYGEALLFFRIALEDDPELFFKYPDMLTDLGRAFQYAGASKEGIDLFLKWESEQGLIPAESENFIRFQLLFFAARIARQRGDKSNIELFEKALPFARAVSAEQADACIWYILDSSLAESADKALPYFEAYIPQWHDDAYFFDVLDKLARELMLKRQWGKMLHILESLRGRSSAAGAGTAKYAWTIGRLIEEGLFSPPGTLPQAAAAYMRAAYNANRSWYYRSMSAASLGQPFLELEAALAAGDSQSPKPARARTRRARAKAKPEESDVMQFLMGFFAHKAASFAPRHIKKLENDLSADELRRLAAALGEAGQYQESIRLVLLYSNAEGYQLARADLELLYPRPFAELVEQYAEETGIEPSVLFGLIRTESAFASDVVSRAGAVGLTQLMPATAKETAASILRLGGPDYTETLDLRNPAVNIHIGATYLAYLNHRMEDGLLALLSYNGGMTRVRRWRTAVGRSTGDLPADLFLETVEYAETRNYGRSVMGAAAMYYELYYKDGKTGL